MLKAILRRTVMGETGTFGLLEIGAPGTNVHHFVTGELPDHKNAADISCIPAGTYLCKRTFSHRFQRETYQVLDVPGRAGIRFHAANLMGDAGAGFKAELNGCIALGLRRGEVHGQDGIVGSRDAVTAFEALLAGADFELTIVDEYLETGAPAGNAVA